jgi:ribosome-associated protein YbcJ (S4-like RNA binding protein)
MHPFAARAVIVGLILSLSVQAASPSAFDPFAGQWTGTLEYQDYGGTGRVKIPVKLTIKPTDATSATWDFAYDDFGKAVNSFETHTWNAGRYTVTTKGKTDAQAYSSADFAALIKSGGGKAVLMGTEVEVGAKVEVRRTITLGKTTLTTLKETRLKSEKFKFRNLSTYTRQP